MNEGRTVFAQILDFLPQYEFDKCVARYSGNFRVRKFPAYEQFLVLAFAQLTWRESLRDIETCLASFGPKLYHAGIRQPTSRSTLADANEKRDWRIFADFAHVLIQQATTLYADEPFHSELQAAAYALDSTTIDLCLSLFPWARFRRHKAAIKLHTLLTLQGNLPTVIIITPGNVHDGTSSTNWSGKRALSTSWIVAISISPDSIGFTNPALSSSPAPRKTSAAPAVTPGPWINPPACALTRP
jgi:hypothetical protein